MKRIFVCFLFLLCVVFSVEGSQSSLFSRNRQIVVNNRVLATINRHSISVLDVMKQMDMVFYKQFSHYTDSVEARYQFYVTNWKYIFRDLINKELVMADAAENQFEISNGDVRQEMEELFGPNIMMNLERIGMTYNEAWEILRSDILIRRMMLGRANMPAMNKIGPQHIVDAYAEFIKSYQDLGNEWVYQVLSIRDDDDEQGKQMATVANELLTSGTNSFDDIVDEVLNRDNLANPKSIKVSEEFHHTDKELSPAYREALGTIEAGSYSTPIAQTSRASGSTVLRIFYLKEIVTQEIPTFDKVEDKLHDTLLQEQVEKETQKYISRLRKRFHVDDERLQRQIPKDFQPFVLM